MDGIRMYDVKPSKNQLKKKDKIVPVQLSSASSLGIIGWFLTELPLYCPCLQEITRVPRGEKAGAAVVPTLSNEYDVG